MSPPPLHFAAAYGCRRYAEVDGRSGGTAWRHRISSTNDADPRWWPEGMMLGHGRRSGFAAGITWPANSPMLVLDDSTWMLGIPDLIT
ncbi:hypothetical protein Nepgr_033947 [Nepenthes gracilis]|uniref:Uncharacterized protein n=1 Tax=Nepenthes gracilis TaxID=150966 RepID=A0AAD3TLK1_NEPGR|nr:hypothetical protein Nepgr_033947 [Nepenthes gracilis]